MKTMVQFIKKATIIFFLLVGVFFFLKFRYFPETYRYGFWMEPFDKHLRKFDFSNFEISDKYKILTFRQGLNDKKQLVLLRHEDSGQLLVLVKFVEYPKVNFSEVALIYDILKMPYWGAERTTVNVGEFSLWSYLPFGWRQDIENAGQDVTIKGIRVDSKEHFETKKTRVLYFRGEFEKLGFFKKTDNWRPYVMPVLDFIGPRMGAVAVINDEMTGETIFAIGCQFKTKNFNEPEFRQIVKSLDFDAIPLPEAFSHIKGLERKTVSTATRP